MTVLPKRRRPDQNTGRRAKVVAEVETLACPNGGLHVLVNNVAALTYCEGCGADWSALDAEAREPKSIRAVVDEYLATEGAS